MNEESNYKRHTISQSVKDKVWNRDNGKCVECDSNEKLEFDHIIPVSKGGSNTYRNIQLLCEPCNRSKSDKIG
jgi:5-methylcytosine-specific restriction endonuclease McrA